MVSLKIRSSSITTDSFTQQILFKVNFKHFSYYNQLLKRLRISVPLANSNWIYHLKTEILIIYTQIKKQKLSQALVVHACNSSYSEGKIRRNSVWSQPSQTVQETLSQKKPITKKGWWRGSRCKLWVQAPLPQKNMKLSKILEALHWGSYFCVFMIFMITITYTKTHTNNTEIFKTKQTFWMVKVMLRVKCSSFHGLLMYD
jgi:hypothetical protein